jgi:hypothetical protein
VQRTAQCSILSKGLPPASGSGVKIQGNIGHKPKTRTFGACLVVVLGYIIRFLSKDALVSGNPGMDTALRDLNIFCPSG